MNKRKEKTMENTCKTCINNDDGLCDRKGILVEDEDFCEHHWAAGKKVRMKRHEKKMEPVAAASCTSTAQVHQIFFRKTGRRYIIHI